MTRLQIQHSFTGAGTDSGTLATLAREASIEINMQDLKDLEASRAFLEPGTKIYSSHLPNQNWTDTEKACRVIAQAGFEAVPHIPVRLLDSAATLDALLGGVIDRAGVREALLIAGDHPRPAGPYTCVMDVLHSGLLKKHGLERVSIGGHPEGHPRVSLVEIRSAEHDKAQVAEQSGLKATFVTQFFFEHAPFLEWVRQLRTAGVRARIVAGLAGPAGIATLFKYAVRCGAGPSIRALGARPQSFMKLVGDHGPERVMRGLAQARNAGTSDFNGLHFFCFGGYLRTCEWLHRIVSERFTLNDNGELEWQP